ncbi:MAG: LuxR family transcriptional regulator [Proteobacteria bacterium]|nr:MAG: LuxR family transcriptional regulator [Pseudomonadota bacterium]
MQLEKTVSIFTPAEHEIFALLCQGLCSKEIAALRGSTAKTVEVHRYNMSRKTGARNVVQLVVAYFQRYPERIHSVVLQDRTALLSAVKVSPTALTATAAAPSSPGTDPAHPQPSPSGPASPLSPG